MNTFEKTLKLISYGYYVGPRDPKRNSAFEGKFMVCADVTEGPSEDASEGEYCIVGDNIDVMVDEGLRSLALPD